MHTTNMSKEKGVNGAQSPLSVIHPGKQTNKQKQGTQFWLAFQQLIFTITLAPLCSE